MSLSVVIPARDAETTVVRAVASVACQEGVAEVLVVDDGSRDGTATLAEEAGARVIRLVPSRGPAVARNRGAGEAASPVVLFLDADVVARPDLARLVLEDLALPGVDAVQGIYAASLPEEPWPTRFQNDYYHHHFLGLDGRKTAVAATFCFALRREVFQELGGFDEAVPDPTVEDEALGYRMYRAGHPILLDGRIRVRHLARYGLRELLARKLRMARAQGKLLRRGGQEGFRGVPTHHPASMMVGVPATALMFVVAAVPLGPQRWWAVALLGLLVGAGSWPFWRHLTRRRWAALPVAAGLTLLDNLAIAAGLALGLLASLAGRKY